MLCRREQCAWEQARPAVEEPSWSLQSSYALKNGLWQLLSQQHVLHIMNNNAVLDRQFLAAGQSRWERGTGMCSFSDRWRTRPSLHTQKWELCCNQTASDGERVHHSYSSKAGRQHFGDRATQLWVCIKKASLCSPFSPLCIWSQVQCTHKCQDQT